METIRDLVVTYSPIRKYVSITFEDTLICEFHNAMALRLADVIYININKLVVTSLRNAKLVTKEVSNG